MSVILILIIASLTLAVGFLAGFIWAVRSGQFEDTYTPSMRLLTEEPGPAKPATTKSNPRSVPAKPFKPNHYLTSR